LGDLYDPGVYSFNDFFDLRFYYGPKSRGDGNPFLTVDDPNVRYKNQSVAFELINLGVLIIQILCCLKEFLEFKGYRFDKTKGNKVRWLFNKFILSLPVLQALMFYLESKQVLGFHGSVCLCKFEHIYYLETDDVLSLTQYMCIDRLNEDTFSYSFLAIAKLVYFLFIILIVSLLHVFNTV